MKIGIDIDNTITDTLPVLREYCINYNDKVVNRNLKINEEGFSTSNLFEWSKEEEQYFCNRYLEEVVNKVTLKENSKYIIEKLKEDGHEITIITARKKPEFSDPYKITKKFLDEKGIKYNNLIVGCSDKESYCIENKIEIMLDDEPQNINSVSRVIPVIVFDGPQNKNCVGKNIIRVNKWDEVYKIICDLNK